MERLTAHYLRTIRNNQEAFRRGILTASELAAEQEKATKEFTAAALYLARAESEEGKA